MLRRREKPCLFFKQKNQDTSVNIPKMPVVVATIANEADEDMAVKLFNAGVIDKFILKGQPGLAETLKNSIFEMQKRYFEDLTDPIVKVSG